MEGCSVVAKPRNGLALQDKQIQELAPKWASLFKSLGPVFKADDKGMMFIPTLKKHTQTYCKSLDASRTVAVGSCNTLNEGQVLFEDLATLDGPIPPELVSKLADIRQKCQGMHQEISRVASSMHEGRQGIIAACNEIDAKKKDLEDKKKKHEQENKAAKKSAFISAIMFIVQLLYELFITSNSLPKENAGLFFLALLPRLGWSAKAQWNEYDKSSREQDVEIKKCEEAAQELRSIAEQLPDLQTIAIWCVRYWDDVEEEFEYTEKNMGDISHNATFKLRMKRNADDLERYKLSFRAYKHALNDVRDHYTPLLEG